MQSFAVPIAWRSLESRELLLPSNAIKKLDYICPQCTEIIRLRGGPVVSEHCYHLTPSVCTGQGVWHAAAKPDYGRI